MAKALLGTTSHPSQLQMLDEIRALRQRVADLESALDEARRAAREHADADDDLVVVDQTPVGA